MHDLLLVSSASQVIYADAVALPLHLVVNAQHGNNYKIRLNKKSKKMIEKND